MGSELAAGELPGFRGLRRELAMAEYFARIVIGDRFGHLTVVGWDECRHRWVCCCDCGKEVRRQSRDLISTGRPMCNLCYVRSGAGKWGRR